MTGKTGGRNELAIAQVAELVDALASGASDRMVVEVRVLSWAPRIFPSSLSWSGLWPFKFRFPGAILMWFPLFEADMGKPQWASRIPRTPAGPVVDFVEEGHGRKAAVARFRVSIQFMNDIKCTLHLHLHLHLLF